MILFFQAISQRKNTFWNTQSVSQSAIGKFNFYTRYHDRELSFVVCFSKAKLPSRHLIRECIRMDENCDLGLNETFQINIKY